jgi:hypothetical protein
MPQQKRRGRSSGMSVLLMLLLILIGAIAAVGTVWFLGEGRLFGRNEPQQVVAKEPAPAPKAPKIDKSGKIAVPVSAREIGAYSAVQTEDLIDAKEKDFAVRSVDPAKAKQNGWVTDINEIRGRVMARDKGVGYAFSEADFMPKGTRPGPAAAIEPGTRGVWIEPKQVQGIDSLRRGDRFDLMAMVRVRDARPTAGSSPEVQAAQADTKAWQSSKRVLVNNGKVIVPTPIDPTRRQNTKIFVQVAEAEVNDLSDALAVNAEIVCYLRSGQPGASGSDLPEPVRPAPTDTIEVIQGGKTTTVQLPGGDAQSKPQDDDGDPRN